MDNRNLGFGHGSEGYNNHNFVPNGEPAENTQGQNVFFQNGEWAYRLAASLQHLGNNEDGENVQVSMNNETEVEEIMGTDNSVDIPVTKKGKKVAASKNIARRGGGFTKAEDKVICSAFLNVSKDAVIGILLKLLFSIT